MNDPIPQRQRSSFNSNVIQKRWFNRVFSISHPTLTEENFLSKLQITMDSDESDAESSVVDSPTSGSNSETVSSEDSDDEPSEKLSKLSDANEASTKHQVHVILEELKNVDLNFVISFQIPRPPIIAIKTKSVINQHGEFIVEKQKI